MVPAAANPSSSIRFRLLGPLTVTVDDEPVPLGGPRQMAVLARLMLTPDQVVSMNQLVESVWDGDEPAQPQVAVRSYISNLRRAIEPNRRRRSTDSCLASSPPGYRLTVDPADIDWVRVERLINAGRRQLAAGDPASAVSLLRQARALWVGEPFSGLPESHFFVAHHARLTELRETAAELLFEALLADGDHSSVAAEVESVIAESPLRERLTELGMLAFYRSGRQSEALALGQKLRARLLDRLGVDPSPSIDAIELKILNHDASLKPVGPIAAPPSPGRVQGADTATEPGLADTVEPGTPQGGDASAPTGQIDTTDPVGRPPASRPDGADDRATGRAAGRAVDRPGGPAGDRAGDRPEQAADQAAGDRAGGGSSALTAVRPVGRTAELRTLAAMGPTLRGGRSATAVITGEQGIGKTTLARAVADGVADEFADDGVAVVWARSLDGESAPLWPWSQVVLSLIGSHRDALELTPDLAPLAELGPSVAGALGPGPSRSPSTSVDNRSSATGFDRTEVMLAVTGLLERLAATRPILLVFEDLHWADPQTLSLLSYAAATLVERPVGFLLTWRATDPIPGPTMAGLRELSRLSNLIRLELDGLDGPAVGHLAASAHRRFTPEELEDVRQRCDGNPLFIREVLANADVDSGSGALGGDRVRWSVLVDAVMGRVDRLHPAAVEVLEASALFNGPFTGDALALVCDAPQETVGEVLSLAVRHGLLQEVDKPIGSYRFRQPVIAEVLASRALATTNAARHGAIGHHLLHGEGPSYEAAHHLARSGSMEDRLVGAQIALTLFHHETDGFRLAEVAEHVAIGRDVLEQLGALNELAAPEQPGRADEGGNGTVGTDRTALIDLRIDSHSYLSWRGWVEGRPDQWLEFGRRQLSEALDRHPSAGVGRGSARARSTAKQPGRRPDPPPPGPSDRLERAVMNLIGSPLQPVGPTSTSDFGHLSARDLEDLQTATERLPTDNPARWAAQIHLLHLSALSKPASNGRQKALREAQKVATAARRKLLDQDSAIVLQVLLSTFCDLMDAPAKLSMVADIGRLGHGLRNELFRTRHAYPALLELGKTFDAERRTETTLHRATRDGNPLLLAEARLLWIRHLLWTGQLDVADDELDQALAHWASLGLGEAVPLLRQRRTLRLLRHHPVSTGHGPDYHHQLLLERSSRAELAFRLARIGDQRRANECLDGILEAAAVSPLSLADSALVAAASIMANHEKAALTMFDLLIPFGDQPVARADGSAIIGPASLYAGLAAAAAGNETAAVELIEAGRVAVNRLGGSPAAAEALIAELRGQLRSNRLPTNP